MIKVDLLKTGRVFIFTGKQGEVQTAGSGAV
jgi:hypothetical protein